MNVHTTYCEALIEECLFGTRAALFCTFHKIVASCLHGYATLQQCILPNRFEMLFKLPFFRHWIHKLNLCFGTQDANNVSFNRLDVFYEVERSHIKADFSAEGCDACTCLSQLTENNK